MLVGQGGSTVREAKKPSHRAFMMTNLSLLHVGDTRFRLSVGVFVEANDIHSLPRKVDLKWFKIIHAKNEHFQEHLKN